MKQTAALIVIGLLAGCEVQPVAPERAAEICEERARAAQSPTGAVTLGSNSTTGPFSRVEIGISSDLIAGRDPFEVYAQCVFDRTGEAPIRPPVLR